MHRIIHFYKKLISENNRWIKRAAFLALGWFIVGFFTFLIKPDLLEAIHRFLDEFFKEVLGEEELALSFQSAYLIWKQNLTAVIFSMFLGIVVGLVPLFAIATNFFVLGFLFSTFVFSSESMIVGALSFAISVLPHGIVEIPTLLLASAFGLKLGLSFRNYGKNLREIILLLPLLALLLWIAAVIEIFVTGNVVKLLVE